MLSIVITQHLVLLFFFFNDTATTEIYTLSLHDALPIFAPAPRGHARQLRPGTGKMTQLIAVLPQQLAGRHLVLVRSEEHTSELQSQSNLVCRLLLEKKKKSDDAQDLQRGFDRTLYCIVH